MGMKKKNKVKIEIDKLKQKEETYYYGTDLKLDVVRKGLNVAVTVFIVTVCLLQTRDFYRTHREIYTILWTSTTTTTREWNSEEET